MKTIRLQIAYDGTAYHGWQVQSRDRTVEGDLTQALAQIMGTDEPIKIQGASRTDAGVHSQGQVAHFHHDADRTLWDFSRGLNGLTDDDICVVRVEEAPQGFHARFSSTGKIYRYRIWNHRFVDPFRRHRAWRVGKEFNLAAMREAAQYLVGEHDFAGFRSVGCSCATTVRCLEKVEIIADLPRIEIVVQGNAFLQYMVRIIAGTLTYVGLGLMEPTRVLEVLQSGDRSRAGRTAPAMGLTLEKVFYPDFPWRAGEPELGGPYMPGVFDGYR